jgi:hypothetical protein
MGGIIGNIGTLVGGNAAKTDRKNELAGIGGLSNLFNFGIDSGKQETGASQDLLGQASGNISKLLTGDRAATLSAVAPAAAAANSQTDAAKRGIATSGTARGGGSNETTLSLEDQKRAGIDSAVNSAKTGATAQATSTGGTMASQASNLLGMGATAAADVAKISSESRDESNKIHQQSVKAVGGLADTAMDLLFA